ncbi:MAG: hypothetical protein ACYSUM_20850 [Planctomycetota bacterium]|jgi:alkanesulfonate monooxygenase SsuD/methylene tetrahydromethanopterin reductase-like flavin-dependent oxidoreductase (luciferase family)
MLAAPADLPRGESEAVERRVSELGQGWFGFDLTPEDLALHLKRIDELLAGAGRSRADEQICASPRGRLEERTLEGFREQGVDQLILPFFGRGADGLRRRADALAKQTLN